MSNNLSQIEKLVLKGHFERSEKAKQESIKGLDPSKLNTEQQKILTFLNHNFLFEVEILYSFSESGRFIARGEDIFGESVIHGTIKQGHHTLKYGGKIEFKKVYIGDPKHEFLVQRADPVHYSGLIKVSEKGVNCKGTYETHRGSPENGTWELSSAKSKEQRMGREFC